MIEKRYDRQKVKEYAERWAYSRNPAYYNFDSLGGDCTNFASQCIYAGSRAMNYHKIKGWYYNNGNDKSPSWSGVEFLHDFLIKNKSVGPYGIENQEKLEIGDIIQLSFDGNKFTHTLVVVEIDGKDDLSKIYTSTHTFDSYHRKVASYDFKKIRFIHINGVRGW